MYSRKYLSSEFHEIDLSPTTMPLNLCEKQTGLDDLSNVRTLFSSYVIVQQPLVDVGRL
ncbi:hypothetical protein Fmac_024761 [Flemingia macrophylla]|uniref:Uncharacterized protein n=1 Tax=Flemingia macrophylla TaxID=520843 RepID=A0ABD1LQE2_9FABA